MPRPLGESPVDAGFSRAPGRQHVGFLTPLYSFDQGLT